MLYTERLLLSPSTLQQLDAIVENDWPRLSTLLGGAGVAENWYHFPSAFTWMRTYLQQHPDEMIWWNYLILYRPDNLLIGSCGYKGAPNAEGELEIGYEIADDYHNQGLATEAAGALVQNAFSIPKVKCVIAHTLGHPNASCSVLQKLGFIKTAELYDPDDGTVWRWDKKKNGI